MTMFFAIMALLASCEDAANDTWHAAALEAYMDVLEDRSVFYHEMWGWRDGVGAFGHGGSEATLLTDFLTEVTDDNYIYCFYIRQFALLILEGDGSPLLILEMWPGGCRLVLHYRLESGTIHGHTFPLRGFFPSMDGIVGGWNATAGDISRLHSRYGRLEREWLYSWIWLSEYELMRVNGELMEFDAANEIIGAAIDYFMSGEPVTFHPFTTETFQAVFLGED